MGLLKPALLLYASAIFLATVVQAQARRQTPDTAVVNLRKQMEVLTSQIAAMENKLASSQAEMDLISVKVKETPDLEKLFEVNDRVQGIDERLMAAESDLVGLKKLRFSGYIQARYEYLDYENLADNATITTNNLTRLSSTSITGNQGQSLFYIRRGRIRFTYVPDKTSEYVLGLDASRDRVSLMDAFVRLTEPWTGYGVNLTVGQMNWPFGIEIERSSAIRELPERSLVIRTLFPGERDRGVRLSVSEIMIGPAALNLDIGVFNGLGIANSTFPWQDPTKQKDFIVRGSADFGLFRLVGSYYDGQTYEPRRITRTYFANTTTGAVTEVSVGSPTVEKRFYKGRLGGGLQVFYQFLPFGGTALFSEYITGKERGRPVAGWYGMLTQNLGSKINLALRVDAYDPFACDDTTKYVEFGGTPEMRKYDQTWTICGAVNYWWDSAVRLTLAYDHVKDSRNNMAKSIMADPKNDKLTVQFQIRF